MINLQGANGCGKTSLMAKISTMVRKTLKDNESAIIIIRFVGTSPESSNITQLLTSVCAQVRDKAKL